MRKKIAAVVSMTMCTAFVLGACSPKEETDVFTGETTEEPEYQANLNAIEPSAYNSVEGLELEPGTYISVIGKTENSAYWNQVKEGVQQAANDLNEALGYSGNDAVKVMFNAPEDGEDIDEQVNILDEEMARYPDVIAIASIDEDACSVQFDLATENGIPIVAFDSGNVYQGIQCTCMTDNVEAAATGVRKLCEKIGDSGEIAVLVKDSVSANMKERVQGITEEITSAHPGVTIVETIYLDQLEWTKKQMAAETLGVSLEELETAVDEQLQNVQEDGGTEEENSTAALLSQVNEEAASISDTEAVQWSLEKHPGLKGCFGTDADTVQLAVKVRGEMENMENMAVAGFDAGKEQVELLENGEISGLVVQNPFGMGYAAVIASARTVLESGNEAFVDTGFVWAEQENLEDPLVKAMLYE